MAAAYTEREKVFAGIMDDRREWEQVTEGKRRLAIAAAAELRRRHPGRKLALLRSAEPEPPTEAQRGELTLTPGTDIPEPAAWIHVLAARREKFAQRLPEERARMVAGWLILSGKRQPNWLSRTTRPSGGPGA